MLISSASSNALTGITRGVQGVRQAASEIASAAQANGERTLGETTRALVDARAHTLSVAASAEVLAADHENAKALLDLFA